MVLHTDEQTTIDLGIFGNRNGGGIYDLYNRTHTRGGEAILKEMFLHPLSDKEAINQRSSIFSYFARQNTTFPFDAALIDMTEKYLRDQQGTLGEREIQNGVASVIQIIQQSREFIETKEIKGNAAYAEEREAITLLIADPAFEPVMRGKEKGKPSYTAIAAYDILFRTRQRHKIEQLLRHIYFLDVCLSVAKVAVHLKFVFPKALEKGSCILKLEGVYHPELKTPVANNVTMNAGQNIIFLTGANMAGKSTFLRSVSTAVYLAHMGFPVAATSMEFSVVDGIYTTINLPDNLGIGASHFYAEVLRVKKMATELNQGRSLFIIFDELFRGTNVKDAHEATVAITNAFAKKKTSIFIISSHIVEAGEALKQRNNIGFLYLPTRMNGHQPEYTYTLQRGITDDRHGMIIIRNEGILDILKKQSP
ncbi:DNA mismatch repair protein [Flavitalea sp. BT771]|uniref:MutS-related protein n=1 Tax=Flavitalea sp. BT771 TaxID=3063329 RepID=UPI0026E3256D|nr:DNA mismatch repair protein [Flavitalea sp. BT771]MDO6434767.1 DNA mismatch repair protein [Flavitalea sp. BT771]MDV6223667.1 DNA mismatch repair protein [Flavitalea sp. BT771]